MKKVITIFLLALCIFSLFAVTANAAPDPLAIKFDGALGYLDRFYDYDYHYMIRIASDAFVSYDEEDMWKPITVSAEQFEAVLHRYFVLTDDQIQELREVGNRDYCTEIWDDEIGEVVEVIPFFDEAAQTYTFTFYGGFGGNLPPREYLGYVKNGETYDVYYCNLTYEFLSDVLPEGTTEEDFVSDEWSDTIEYGGNIYQSGPEGYYRLKSRDNYGRKYTVELKDDMVRIISCVDYTEDQQPDTFDDKEVADQVIYDIPADGNISFAENDCFEVNTIVKVEEITDSNAMQTIKQAMQTVAEKYMAYEFTATKDNVAVQPNGKLTVTFAIPDDYSDNVIVFYMAKDGTLKNLSTTVDAAERTATVQLKHFSTYILADISTKPHQHSYEKVITNPTCTTEGYTTYTCDCGDTYTADPVSVTDHSYEQWQETKAPTYTEEGSETRKCIHCDHTETRTVPVLTQPDTQPSDPTQPATTPDETPSKDTNSGNAGMVVAVIAIVVIALGAAAFVVIRKKK